MHRFARRSILRGWITGFFCVLAAATSASAQDEAINPGGDTTPPTITFTPISGTTVYSASPSITIEMCDNTTLNGLTRRVALNGDTVPYAYTSGVKTGCASYGTAVPAVAALRLRPGVDTLEARVCDTSGNCTARLAIYTYVNGPDITPPTVQISPASSGSTPSFTAVVTLCDERKLGTWRSAVVDTAIITANWTYTPQPGTSSCPSKATFGGPILLNPGDNVLTVEVRDSAGNSGAQSVTYTYRPSIDVSPTNQTSVAPGMFDATLSYSTPSYRSLDQDRGITLFYSSSQASPVALVQLDVTDNSTTPAPRTSIRLQRNGAFQQFWGGATELFYTTGLGTSRISAGFDASGLATGAYTYTALVKQWDTPTTGREYSVPVRVLVLNERTSVYGAGWSIPGVERVVPTTGGIMITQGDGSAGFYAQYTNCNLARQCYFTSPPGDFSLVSYDSTNTRYVRRDVDGTLSYFSASGRLTTVQDRLGNAVTYQYDGSGRLIGITDPVGLMTGLGYYSDGTFMAVTLPDGRRSQFQVDQAGDLTMVWSPAAAGDLLPFDTDLQPSYQPGTHRLTQWVDQGGRTSNAAYGGKGRLVTITGPQYAANDSTFRETITFASQDSVVLPANGKGTASVAADRVDPTLVRARVTDYHGRTTQLKLDRWGAPTRVEDPWGYVSSTARNSAGQVVATVDESGNVGTYVWNGPNLVRATTGGTTANYSYDSYGQVLDVTGAGPETHNFYNSTTGVLDSTSAVGAGTTHFTYDARGRVLTSADAMGHATTIVYADTSTWKNTATVTAGGRTTRYRHDDSGRVQIVTDADGKNTLYEYDIRNRVTAVNTPDQGRTAYNWGSLFLDQVVTPRGQAYTWTRNALGWTVGESRPGDPTQPVLTAKYDRYGRVVSATNRRNQSVSFTYDGRDRVATRTADGQTTTFGYSPDDPAHPNGPTWVSVANPESVDTLRYNEKGQLTEAVTWRPFGGVWKRYSREPHYSTLGQLIDTRIATSAGRDSVSFGYDEQTYRMRNFRDMAQGLTSIGYSGEGLPEQTTFPNGLVSTQQYSSTHMLEGIRYPFNVAIDNAAGVRYRFDALNRVKTRLMGDGWQRREFGYDPTGRWLSSMADSQATSTGRPSCAVSADDGSVCDNSTATWNAVAGETYAYDLTGNPTDRGAVRGAGDRLTQFNGFTMTYDGDGNLATKTGNGLTQTFTWNALGLLTSVTTNGGTVSYGYDGMGQRVRKQVSGVNTGYLYDGINLLYELDGAGAVTAKYTYYPGSLRPHSVVRNGASYYYATDVQGSVLALFNTSNQVMNRYTYLPFGEAQSVTSSVPNRIRYAGRELEDETGLYYNNARWYDPTLHRFISQDPIGLEGGINLYSYVANDPVNFTDPSGLEMEASCEEMIMRFVPGMSFALARAACSAGVVRLAPLTVVAQRPTPVPASSCDIYRCELEFPTPLELERVRSILQNGMKAGHPECVATQAAGLDAVGRQLLVYRNVVRIPTDRLGNELPGRFDPSKHRYYRPILGNSPWDWRLPNPGPVMYLYIPSGTMPVPQVVWHEADHDVIRFYTSTGFPVTRGEYDISPHGDRDGWARACRR